MTDLFIKSKLQGSYTNAQGQLVKLYITQAYDSFILSGANRQVVEMTVKRLMRSMLVKVEHAPILVNEKGEVIDGQNRLAAYKRLNLPVTFEMISGLNVDTIRRLNTIQKEWTILDHLHAGAVENEVSYKWLHNFCKTHSLQPSTALILLKGTQTANPMTMTKIRDGSFTCTAEERRTATERLAVLEQFRVYSKATSKNFTTALVRVLEVPGLDIERLVITFHARYKMTLAGIAGSYEGYMFQLQEMYNYKLGADKKLRFLSAIELERLNRKG
jgi:hypothetical protein